MTQPTKTLHASAAVQDILGAMRFEQKGATWLGYLPDRQLERKLYEEVNKFLAAKGGQWNRSLKAHVFNADPRAVLDLVAATGELVVVKDGFFPTPFPVIELMLEQAHIGYEKFGGQHVQWRSTVKTQRLLEPSAGDGAILLHLKLIDGLRVDWCELDEQRRNILEVCGVGGIEVGRAKAADFLTYQPGPLYDRILMNPPFERLQDIDHVRHAYELLASGGRLVSIMSASPFFQATAKAITFREWLDAVDGQADSLPPNSFKESGTGVNAYLVTIDRPFTPATED